jgi:hypothetical protein
MAVFVRAMARRRARETRAEGDVQPTPVGAIANADLGRRLLAESRVRVLSEDGRPAVEPTLTTEGRQPDGR